MRKLFPGVTHGFVLILFLFLATTAFACPSCSEAVGGQGEALTRGWSRSIFLMMGAPYVLFAGAAFYIARAARRKREHRPQ